jgi:uroporphyrin-3 C-methyltransferase
LFSENNSSALPLLERATRMLQMVNDPNLLAIRDAIATAMSALKAQPVLDINKLYGEITALDQTIDKLELPFAPLSTDTKMTNDNSDPETPWWKKGLQHSANVLKQVVVVKRNDSKTLPIVMPDEKAYLYQNLHAQVENMIWGLLHHEQVIYQTSIARMQLWINTYYVQNSAVTLSVLDQLKELQGVNLSSQKIDLSPTLKLFEQYLMTTHSESLAQ